MPPRHRRLSEADQALWAAYTRQVAPLPAAAAKPAPLPAAVAKSTFLPDPVAVPPARKPRVQKPPPPSAPDADITAWLAARGAPAKKHRGAALAVGDHPSGLDRSTWNKFRTGRLAAARTIDLHGMTAQRAHNALTAFLRSAHTDQVRVVEVVTGRGSGETGGVIRRELPFWLNLPDIRPMILGASHPHPQNPGSVRLILRRIR